MSHIVVYYFSNLSINYNVAILDNITWFSLLIKSEYEKLTLSSNISRLYEKLLNVT